MVRAVKAGSRWPHSGVDELGPLLGCEPGALTVVDLCLVNPGPHRGLTQIEVLGYLADAAVALSAQLDGLSLELRVKDRRGRGGFFRSMVSILDILSGAVPLMVDVRQSEGSPDYLRCLARRPATPVVHKGLIFP